ncbi:beta-4C adrenergic receptor-like [Actinia tenebrosa]|uniref:Beta-4C adrenergic receptor-like n=1 Tax=Actinia tenebrosa TaxID=6105 RepID=A0A6P8IE03_ACTTE|nr:beta-4C adrenergic receptor-like [Actinia tenebrosa]
MNGSFDNNLLQIVCRSNNNYNTTISFINILLENSYLQSLLLAIFNAIFAVPTTIANLLVIIAVFTTPELRTPSFYLVTNLALTDLFMGLVCQTGYSLFAVSYFNLDVQTLCISYVLFTNISMMVTIASGLTVTVISIDRYLAISLKLRYRSTVTLPRIRRLLVVLWVMVFILTSLPLYTSTKWVGIFGSIVFTICLFTIIFCYSKSFRALKVYCNQTNPQGSHQGSNEATPSNAIDVLKYKKLLKTMVLILGLVLICYLPLLVIFITFEQKGDPEPIFSITMLSIVGLNSTLNPIIYLVRMRDIRRACIRITKRLLCKP